MASTAVTLPYLFVSCTSSSAAMVVICNQSALSTEEQGDFRAWQVK
jgi:hypothetical protein